MLTANLEFQALKEHQGALGQKKSQNVVHGQLVGG
jgi:hypothetical protein